jgi:hypothetical protein
LRATKRDGYDCRPLTPAQETKWYERPSIVAVYTTILGAIFGKWIAQVPWWQIVAFIIGTLVILLLARTVTRRVLADRSDLGSSRTRALTSSLSRWDMTVIGVAAIVVMAAGYFAAQAIEEVI